MSVKRDLGYDFIRFTAIIIIIIHHLFTAFREFGYNVPLSLKMIVFRGSIGFGGLGVALFFILSGALLYKKYKDQFNLPMFYYKRFLRIEIPQWIGFICAFALMYCLRPKNGADIPGIIISFFGLNYSGIFWNHLNIRVIWLIGEWFTAVIIICYALFPLLRKLFLKKRGITTLLISLLFCLNVKYEIFTYGNGWFSITNGIMYFWCGMLFEEYKRFLSPGIIYLNYIFVLAFIYFNPIAICGL